jgi:hypothetical protein
MFGWSRKEPSRVEPEARWSVALNDSYIRVTDQAGETLSLAKSDLFAVAIETHDTGPWDADVWWLLFGADERLQCSFPQGASGDEAAVDYLVALPEFDHRAMVRAMATTDNAIFPVWRTKN